MADEKLRYIFDVIGDSKVEKAFAGVGSAATVHGAKVEAGSAKMTSSLGAFAAKAAPFAAAGATVAAAAMKSVNAFRDLALESGKFADASGLTVEAASRWIEVAGDVGIETSAIEAATIRMNRALGASPKVLRSLGIEAVYAANGAVDVNETFLATIDVLNGMTDPTERAAAAAKVFGRGWADLSELIGRGSKQLRADLGAVGDGKVIDEEELEKARAYRDAMDKLSDAVGELSLALGENLAPALTEVADLLTKVSVVAGPAMDHLSKGFAALGGEGSSNVHRVAAAFVTLGGSEVLRGLRNVGDALRPEVKGSIAAGLASTIEPAEQAEQALTQFGTAIEGPVTQVLRNGNRAAEEFTATLEAQARSAGQVRREMAGLRAEFSQVGAEFKSMRNELDEDDAWASLAQSLSELAVKFKRGKDKGAEFEQQIRDANREILDFAQNSSAYVPPNIVATIMAEIDEGALAEALRRLSNIRVNAQIIARGGAGYGSGGPRAMGGAVAANVAHVVGERGPEVFVPSVPGQIVPNHALGGGGTAVVVNVAGSVVTERQLVDAVHEGLLRKGRALASLGLS